MKTDGDPRQRSSLRFQYLNGFADTGGAGLTPSAAWVWFIIYRWAQPDGKASVSCAQIEDSTGLTLRTISRAVKELKERKLLKILKRGGVNQGATLYRIFPYSVEQGG